MRRSAHGPVTLGAGRCRQKAASSQAGFTAQTDLVIEQRRLAAQQRLHQSGELRAEEQLPNRRAQRPAAAVLLVGGMAGAKLRGAAVARYALVDAAAGGFAAPPHAAASATAFLFLLCQLIQRVRLLLIW